MAAIYGPLALRMPPNAAFEEAQGAATGTAKVSSLPSPAGAENKPPEPVSWQNRGYTSMVVLLHQLPADTTTLDIYKSMAPLAVLSIDLKKNAEGQRSGTARVRLVPPLFDYWYDRTWCLKLRGPPARSLRVPAQVDSHGFGYDKTPLNRWVRAEINLNVALLGQGFMYQKQTMMVMDEVSSTSEPGRVPPTAVSLKVSFSRRELSIFVTRFLGEGASGQGGRGPAALARQKPVQYRIDIRFSWIKNMWEQRFHDGRTCIVLALDSPPSYWRKSPAVTDSHTDDHIRWYSNDQWCRMAYLTTNLRAARDAAVSLQSSFPEGQAVDLGRWTTFRLDLDKANADQWKDAADRLRNCDAHLKLSLKFRFLRRDNRNMWVCMGDSHADASISRNPAAPPLASVVASSSSNVYHLSRHLSFDVAYQLEVCISRGILHENTLDVVFLQSLAALPPDRGTRMLEYVAERGKRIYKPHSIFQDPKAASYWRKTPPVSTTNKDQAVYVRKAMVTPTTIVYATPALEAGNRVLRYFRAHHDRFLRVQFTDELLLGRLNGGPDTRRTDDCFSRAFRALKNGIRVGGRHFEFLAFGNSQLRENGAYFFAPTDLISCQDIRDWMGDFSSIKTVAKYAARLGQCLSTTRPVPTFGAPTTIQRIPDVERGRYCFTDGVGKISKWWARVIASHLRIEDVPSAVQFRMGGCKGILVVWPDVPSGQVIQIRPSQEKFPTADSASVLEIVRCSETASATLNQQVILLLLSLGVPAAVFMELLEEELAGLDAVMEDPYSAVAQLMMRVDQNQVSPVIADMVKAGFMRSDEPFVWALLQLWRSWTLKFLKEKAHITVEKSAFVLGCVDETDTLRGHTDKEKTTDGGDGIGGGTARLPQIFLQVPDLESAQAGVSMLARGGHRRGTLRRTDKYKVITGPCLVGRNPSLHPGDLRVVEAVDVPALHHLHDVVVFPRTGDQDLPGMCSGGDLDGDDYFVFWDHRLLPPRASWNYKPMNYDAVREPDVDQVTPRDLIAFFVQHMKHDTLSPIAMAHRGFADQLEGGAMHPRCLELAQLHSQAVDFAKTGVPALMPQRLQPKKWPHWMNRAYKQSYESKTALGYIFDRVQIENFEPVYDKPFDARILSHYPHLDAMLLCRARRIKTKYDLALRRAMAQKEVETEFEFWTAFRLSRPRVGTDYKAAEDIGRLYKVIMTRFRRLCLREAGGSYDVAKLGPFVAAMYTVTYQELRIALHQFAASRARPENSAVKSCDTVDGGRFDQRIAPLISFPWLFTRELGIIANAADIAQQVDERKKTPTTAPRVAKEAWAHAVTEAATCEPITGCKVFSLLTQEELEKMGYKVKCGVPTHHGIPLDVSAHGDAQDDEDDGGQDEDNFEPMWTLPPGVSEGDIVIKPTAAANLSGEGLGEKNEANNDNYDLLGFGLGGSNEQQAPPGSTKLGHASTDPFPWADLEDDVLSTTSEESLAEKNKSLVVQRDADDDDEGVGDECAGSVATDEKLPAGLLKKRNHVLNAAKGKEHSGGVVGGVEEADKAGAAKAIQGEEEEDGSAESEDNDVDDGEDMFATVSNLFGDKGRRGKGAEHGSADSDGKQEPYDHFAHTPVSAAGEGEGPGAGTVSGTISGMFPGSYSGTLLGTTPKGVVQQEYAGNSLVEMDLGMELDLLDQLISRSRTHEGGNSDRVNDKAMPVVPSSSASRCYKDLSVLASGSDNKDATNDGSPGAGKKGDASSSIDLLKTLL